MDPSASIGLGLAVIAAITTTYGNLMAYAQTNLNRLLGYSTIAHAGVLLAGVATLRRDGLTAVLIYLAAYLLANFGAFAVVAAIRLRRGREDVQGVDGLMSDSPALGVALAMTLASLLGLPPLAGFAGKFAVFSAMAELKDPAWRVLLFIMIANTAISAGYYFILIRRAAFEEAPSERSGQAPTPLKVIALTCGVASLLLGVLWNPLVSLASAAVGGLK
jgi:NADH-quinone oxidoreductase subunit N